MEKWKDKEYLLNEFVKKRRTAKEIAEELNVNDSSIEYYLGKFNLYGIRNRLKHTVDVSKFKVEDPIFNYYCGLIATDGYVDLKNNRVSIRLKNSGAYELLSNIKSYFNYTGEIKLYRESYDLTITSPELIKALRLLNIDGDKKTYKLKFPTKFYSDLCAQMYCRGVLDGDGNIKVQTSRYTGKIVGGQFRLVTASEDFVQELITFLNFRFNFNYSVSTARVKGVNYPKIEMKVQDSKEFYNWIYSDFLDYKLQDKYDKYLLVR